jgi:DNA invertase Pin-like site-specific DNA recombinase
MKRAALYARVSTGEQSVQNQLLELRAYTTARGWSAKEFTDEGVSGAKDRRPALDELLRLVRQRKVDVVVVWSLDRLGRSLRHLIALLDEFQSVGVGFMSLKEGLDCTTPAGRLQWQIIGAISEFERARLRERVMAGLHRAVLQGKTLGRPKGVVPTDRLASVAHLSMTDGAIALGVSRSTMKRWRRGQKTSAPLP